MEREAFCKIVVVAAGGDLTKQAQCLSEGQAVRVEGFLARADNRQGEQRLILHAKSIKATH